MKGYRFYEELENKNRKGEISKGTVLALPLDEDGIPLYFCSCSGMCVEVISSVFAEPNSPVCGSAADDDYIYYETKRVSEKRAREIHPALFAYLEN